MAIDGALAALASVALGEHIALATAAGLGIVVAGMLVVLFATAAQERAGVAGHSLTAVFAGRRCRVRVRASSCSRRSAPATPSATVSCR